MSLRFLFFLKKYFSGIFYKWFSFQFFKKMFLFAKFSDFFKSFSFFSKVFRFTGFSFKNFFGNVLLLEINFFCYKKGVCFFSKEFLFFFQDFFFPKNQNFFLFPKNQNVFSFFFLIGGFSFNTQVFFFFEKKIFLQRGVSLKMGGFLSKEFLFFKGAIFPTFFLKGFFFFQIFLWKVFFSSEFFFFGRFFFFSSQVFYSSDVFSCF